MRYTVVTSCSRSGWEAYGRRFMQTFAQYWPAEVELAVYSEDLKLQEAGNFDVRGRLVDLHAASASREFCARHADDLEKHGRRQLPHHVGWTDKKKREGYNFRYDAVRFAKKVFAIEAAAQGLDGRLFWLDMDVVTFAPVPLALLERMLPAEAALSCLDRGELYHSECGFVGYNLEDPECRRFIAEFAALYATDTVFGLQEWHDSWVFDSLRRKLGVLAWKIPHNSRSQPFINSDLGKYMDHMKGSSKERGRTKPELMVAGHRHAYWGRP